MMKNWLPALFGSGERARPDDAPVERRRGELGRDCVAGAAAARACRVAALRHEVVEHAVKGNTVVEAAPRQGHEAVDVLRGQVRSQPDLDVALLRLEDRVVGLAHVDRHHRGAGRRRSGRSCGGRARRVGGGRNGRRGGRIGGAIVVTRVEHREQSRAGDQHTDDDGEHGVDDLGAAREPATDERWGGAARRPWRRRLRRALSSRAVPSAHSMRVLQNTVVPPTGLEPVLPAPEAGALSD